MPEKKKKRPYVRNVELDKELDEVRAGIKEVKNIVLETKKLVDALAKKLDESRGTRLYP